MWSLLDVNFDFVDQKVTLWRVGPVVKHGALTGRPGRRHALSTWTSHAPTYTCEHGPKTQNHVLRPWTWTMPLLKHAPPPQSNVAETWSWKPYGRHHAPCTWPHPHTRYDDTQQVAHYHSFTRLLPQVAPDVPSYDSQATDARKNYAPSWHAPDKQRHDP